MRRAKGYTQLELVYTLRYLIDTAAQNPPTQQGTGRSRRRRGEDGILRLVDDGARIGTKHVLWNIGASRRRWLLAFLGERRPDWRPNG